MEKGFQLNNNQTIVSPNSIPRSTTFWNSTPIQKQRRRSLQEVAQRKLLNKFKLQSNEEVLMKRRQSTPVPKLEECLMEFNFQRSASEPNGNERKRRKSAGTIDCTKLEQAALAPQGDRIESNGSISPLSGDICTLPHLDFTSTPTNSPRAQQDENMLNKLTSRFFQFQLQQ